MSKKPILFNDAESDSDVEIKTNNEYATHYDKWRQKEEMNKLKTKYGDQFLNNSNNEDISDDDETSSSEDDEDGRELTEEFEKDFFKTLSCLKNKDPKIYDDNVVFFENKNNNTVIEQKTKKNSPMFLKDYERKMILEKGAKFEDSDEDEQIDLRSDSPTYVQQQQQLKESLKEALKEDDNDDEHWGGLFSKREKTKEEQDDEEDDYKKWLKGATDQLDNKEEETALKPLKEYWNKPDLDNTEKFLRDYLLNKKYLENEDKTHIPSYEEIIHDSDEGLSEDENQIEKQEEFEHKYNFRYEEPDQEFIKRYPRTMEHSVRKTDDRRKLKRQEIKQRKEEEKKQKQEEIKQLKIYKRKEIEEKIKMLKEITGNEEMAFKNMDLDGDFNPDEHDKRMRELFNDEYYKGEEGDLKPEFSDLDEELGPWKDSNEPHCEDDDFIMDADYDPSTSVKKDKKRRNRPGKKTKTDDDIDDLPIDKNDEQYEKYMDELYKLDCEDMIGDLPCRFKYREVLPNDFGLSVEEILLAKDKELNRWCSLKKTMQYRPEHMEKYDAITYKRKAMNEEIKKKLLPSLYDESIFEEDTKKEEQVMKMNEHENFQGIDEVCDKTNENSEEQNLKKNNETIGTNEEEISGVTLKKDKKKNMKKLKPKTGGLTKRQKKKEEQVMKMNEDKNFQEIDEICEKTEENSEEQNLNKKPKNEIFGTNEEEISGATLEKKKKKNMKKLKPETGGLTRRQKKKEEQMTKMNNENSEEHNLKKKKRKNEIFGPNEEEISSATLEKEKKKNEEELKPKTGGLTRRQKKMNEHKNFQGIDEVCEKTVVNSEEPLKKKKRKNEAFGPKQEEISGATLKIEKKKNMKKLESGGLTRRQKKNKKKILSKSNESSTTESKPKKENRKRKLSTQEGDGANNPKKKQKLNTIKKKQNSNNKLKISDARLEAYGINPKKYKNKIKYKNKKNIQ